MRNITYLAVLEPTNTGYSVYYPDVPGCISVGKDIQQAATMAKEALQFHIYTMEKDGEKIPKASLKPCNEDVVGCILMPITIFPDLVKNELDHRRIKTNVTIPAWLKDLAEAKGVNYSRLLEAALLEVLDCKGYK